MFCLRETVPLEARARRAEGEVQVRQSDRSAGTACGRAESRPCDAWPRADVATTSAASRAAQG